MNFVKNAQSPRSALVVGAGLAGCAVANRLAARGVEVTLVDALPGLARATSGNLMGAVRPLLNRGDTTQARFTRAAFIYTLETLHRLRAAGHVVRGEFHGLLHLAKHEVEAAKMRTLLNEQNWPAEYVRWVNEDEATLLAGVQVARGGYWFPSAGWLDPSSYCQALVNEHIGRITLHWNTEVRRLEDFPTEIAVLANAHAVLQFAPDLPLHTVRGQVSYVPASAFSPPRIPVAGDGYVMPVYQGVSVVGATYEHDNMTLDLLSASHAENHQRLTRLLPHQQVPPFSAGRSGLRTVAANRLPVMGQVPGMANTFVLTALASRGITWCSLAAEQLAAMACGEPLTEGQSTHG